MSEEERKTCRKEVRRKIAEATVWEHRLQALRDVIDEANRKKEALADEFAAKVTPCRAELAEIDRKQVDRVLGGGEPDAKLEGRRRTLLDEIFDANTYLQDAIARQDKRLAALEDERRETAQKPARQLLMQELAELASPELRQRLRDALRGRISVPANKVWQECVDEEP